MGHAHGCGTDTAAVAPVASPREAARCSEGPMGAWSLSQEEVLGYVRPVAKVSQGQLPPEPLDPDIVEARPMEISTGSF